MPEGQLSGVLQIPVHPFCSGIFLEATDDILVPEMLFSHWKAVFEQKYASADPIIFYDHPTPWMTAHFDIIDRLFAMAFERRDVWICQMREFADWCLARNRINLSVAQEPFSNTIRISANPFNSSFALNFFRNEAKSLTTVALKGGAQIVNLSDAVFNERNPPFAPSNSMRSRCSFMEVLKRNAKRALDWETTTPVRELIVSDVQTAVKKLLRAGRGSWKKTAWGKRS